jgi:hypothetical protein
VIENQEQMTNDGDSNYRETDQSVRGLRTYEQAESLRELTERALTKRKQDADYCLRIDERSDGLFDLIVLKRVN